MRKRNELFCIIVFCSDLTFSPWLHSLSYIIRNCLNVLMLTLAITKPATNLVLVHRQFLVRLFPDEEKQLDGSHSRMWKAWFKVMS